MIDKEKITDKDDNLETASKFLAMIFGISEDKRKEWTKQAKRDYCINKGDVDNDK